MGTPSVAAIVLVSFPFSDLSAAKLRPAIVLVHAGREDWILCQITSNPYADARALEISDSDFAKGSLRRTSYARPGKLFTADHSLIVRQVGVLKSASFNSIIDAVIDLFRGSLQP
jgi:mRNA interferase MazF